MDTGTQEATAGDGRSPIDAMIDAVVTCIVCGSKPGACDCWITLRCPKCEARKVARRDKSDPPGTAVISCLCPECAGGDFSLVDYFDKSERQILPPHSAG